MAPKAEQTSKKVVSTPRSSAPQADLRLRRRCLGCYFQRSQSIGDGRAPLRVVWGVTGGGWRKEAPRWPDGALFEAQPWSRPDLVSRWAGRGFQARLRTVRGAACTLPAVGGKGGRQRTVAGHAWAYR